MWKNHFDVYVILHHSLRNGLVWTGKRRTFKTWSIVKFELFKTNWLTFGIRNSRSGETHFLPTSFLDLIKLHFVFWGMRISQNLGRTEFLFMIFLSLFRSFFLSLFPSFSLLFCISGFVAFFIVFLSYIELWLAGFFSCENTFYKNIEAEDWDIWRIILKRI